MDPIVFYFRFNSREWTVSVNEDKEREAAESWTLDGSYAIDVSIAFEDDGFYCKAKFVDGSEVRFESLNEAESIWGFVSRPTDKPRALKDMFYGKSTVASTITIEPVDLWEPVDLGESTIIGIIRATVDEALAKRKR